MHGFRYQDIEQNLDDQFHEEQDLRLIAHTCISCESEFLRLHKCCDVDRASYDRH